MASVPALQSKSAIPSLRTLPSVPGWVDLADLDAEQFFMPALPPRRGDELRAAANSHRDALVPASRHDAESVLGELRLRTIVRTESRDEVMARHRCLLDDLAGVPEDILRAACNAYVSSPGSRFYPTAGELRAHIDPLISQRRVRWSRLERMAKESDEAFDPAARCTPEQATAIRAEFGI